MTTIKDYINSAAASLYAGNLKNGHEDILNALRGLLARVEAGEKPEAEETLNIAAGQVWGYGHHEDIVLGIGDGEISFHCKGETKIRRMSVVDFVAVRKFIPHSEDIEAQTAEQIATWIEKSATYSNAVLAGYIRSGAWRQKAGT